MNLIQEYCTAHTTGHSSLLNDLERETYLKTLAPQMLTGQYQGQLLSLLSKLIRPQNILEVGTFTGYSAICMAQGLLEDGKLTTIEINPELSHISQKYFDLSPYKHQINSIIGDAMEIIPTLEQSFGLVFIDAAKQMYDKYYEIILPKTSKGGIIIADNILWSGKVINKIQDKDTKYLDQFNKKIFGDIRVENIVLPIRDGINIIRKL